LGGLIVAESNGLPAPHNVRERHTDAPEMFGIADPRQLHYAGPQRKSLIE
jgi:hypothetical protein